MVLKYVIPALALIGAIFAVIVVRAGNKPVPASQPIAQPAASPFTSYIAGAGIVEARTENIAIGTGEGGTVIGVYVKIGDKVAKGQPLFQIRNFTQKAELKQAEGKAAEASAAVAQANAAVIRAQADLQRLVEYPRPEEIPPAEAKVKEAEATAADMKSQWDLYKAIWEKDQRAVSEDDLTRRKYAVQTAQAKLDAARADLTLLKAGTWKPDIDVARAKLEEAKAQLFAANAGVASAAAGVDAAAARLEKLTIKAPVDATMLQVKIHEGEYAQNSMLTQPLMVLGDIETLVVRTDVDENDAWRFQKGAKAVAFVRGNRDQKAELYYYRVEPYVVPKRSLTGESTERVDTRVLQVLYSFPKQALPNIFVGQQMDVYIESLPAGATTQGTSKPSTQSN